jgi:hypothetical protein
LEKKGPFGLPFISETSHFLGLLSCHLAVIFNPAPSVIAMVLMSSAQLTCSLQAAGYHVLSGTMLMLKNDRWSVDCFKYSSWIQGHSGLDLFCFIGLDENSRVHDEGRVVCSFLLTNMSIRSPLLWFPHDMICWSVVFLGDLEADVDK